MTSKVHCGSRKVSVSFFKCLILSQFLTAFRLQHDLNPFPNDKFYIPSIRNNLQMTILKIDENSRKLSRPVENTVGKGEIARYEQFLLFPQCFRKVSTAELVWERVNLQCFLKWQNELQLWPCWITNHTIKWMPFLWTWKDFKNIKKLL